MDYHQKYLKYKNKYMLLKQSINNNNLEGGVLGVPTVSDLLSVKPPLYYTTLIMVGDNRLNIVPVEKRTQHLCLMAVNRNSWDLEFVPEQFKTYDMCLKAVQDTGRMLKYVPRIHKDTNMYHNAIINSKYKDRSTIKYVDSSTIPKNDYDFLVEKAVTIDGDALEHIDNNIKTFKLCDIAVNSRKSAIQYVPKQFYDTLWNKHNITKKDFEISFTPGPVTYISGDQSISSGKPKTYLHRR